MECLEREERVDDSAEPRLAGADENERGGSVPLVRAVQRAMAILRAFEGKGLQTLAEVTAATGLDKGTTRRLLLTLATDGFVMQDPRSQRWGLGPSLRTLAASVVAGADLREAAVPLLAELAAELHITAFLSVFRDGQAVCLERVHDMKGMEVRWWAVGGTLPLNVGGAPKVMLAYQDDAEIDRCLARSLTALTPRSVTDPLVIRRYLAEVRRRGWDLAVDDVVVGLSALAVPVLDGQARLVCCVSIAGLTPQMVDRGRPVHLARLQEVARGVSAALG
jgi:DNA-binding IclR family transcriptional regulator